MLKSVSSLTTRDRTLWTCRSYVRRVSCNANEYLATEEMMKLLYSPGECSVGIHILLEEIGKPYEIERVSFAYKEQHLSDFKKINPKSKVPVLLRDDGSALTEFPAIATWLARTNPAAGLFPEDAGGRGRPLEARGTGTAP